MSDGRRPTHVLVCRWVDSSDGQDKIRQDWSMPIEEFAKLFETVEPLLQCGPNFFKAVPLAVTIPPETDE